MSNILDIEKCIKSLSDKRPIFHSEADFQVALAWEIQKGYPKANIRLEYPVDKMNIDIVVFCGEKMIPIELKWLRTDFECCIKGADGENGEKFKLALSGADAEVRYDCLKDIERIENISEICDDFVEGYTIWLTNSEKYWESPKNIEKTCKNFTVHHTANIKCNSTLEWSEHTDIKTIKKHEKISLKNSYTFSWEDYSIIAESDIEKKAYHKQNKFKYCITPIKKPS